MKTRNLKLVALVIVLLTFGATTFAQVTATATATATIITPISIVKATDMSFGNLAVNASAGTVVLPAAAPTPVRTRTGGVTLPATAGTVTSAAFTVSGLAAATYSISLPASASLTGPGSPMTADNFVSSPTVAAGGVIGAGGNQTLYVGATLNVAGSQTAGTYTSAAFSVTVNYN